MDDYRLTIYIYIYYGFNYLQQLQKSLTIPQLSFRTFTDLTCYVWLKYIIINIITKPCNYASIITSIMLSF